MTIFALACEAMSALTVTKQTSKVANNFIASDTETPQVLKPNYFRATAGPEGLTNSVQFDDFSPFRL